MQSSQSMPTERRSEEVVAQARLKAVFEALVRPKSACTRRAPMFVSVPRFARTGIEPVIVYISGYGPTDTHYVDQQMDPRSR